MGQGLGQGCKVVAPARPICGVPDVEAITVHHAKIVRRIRRSRKLFTAQFAAIMVSYHRSAALQLRSTPTGKSTLLHSPTVPAVNRSSDYQPT